MAAAAARRPARPAHGTVTRVRRFAHAPLCGRGRSAPLGVEASAWRRRTGMLACALIALAALAAAWSPPTSAPTDAALRTPPKTVAATRQAAAAPAATRHVAASALRIAVVDTGVAAVGPLAGQLVAGADFVDQNGTTDDHNGHGTAMASIAGGLCGACAIEPVRVLGDSGMGTTDLAAKGVSWAAANGARVINLSLTSRGPDPALTTAIENAVAGGAVVVVAAGNSGSTDPAAEGYPGASATDAITVGSVDPSRQLYPWSNHGSWVRLGAPGVLDALSTRGTPVTATGTSGSAAYVSGVAALLLGCNPALTPAQVRALLTSSATPVPSLGGGLVDPQAALRAAGCA